MASVKENAVEAESPGGGGSTKGIKVFLILLLALDLIAGGAYGWLALVQRKNVEQDLKRAREGVIRAKEQSDNLEVAVDRIAREKQQRVSVLGDLVRKVALNFRLKDGGTLAEKIETQKGRQTRWKNSAVYEEVTTEVRFYEKVGYPFQSILEFLMAIEKTNPKVQIKAINFNQRDETTEDPDIWRPLTMTVRAFTPTARK